MQIPSVTTGMATLSAVSNYLSLCSVFGYVANITVPGLTVSAHDVQSQWAISLLPSTTEPKQRNGYTYTQLY